jgi:hypothetical protein
MVNFVLLNNVIAVESVVHPLHALAIVDINHSHPFKEIVTDVETEFSIRMNSVMEVRTQMFPHFL